jgi:hypothetical protein
MIYCQLLIAYLETTGFSSGNFDASGTTGTMGGVSSTELLQLYNSSQAPPSISSNSLPVDALT